MSAHGWMDLTKTRNKNMITPKVQNICGSTLQAETPSGLYPLSFNQRDMWFQRQIHGEGGLNNISARILIGGELQVDLWREALQRVVNRHGVLRTVAENPPAGAIIDYFLKSPAGAVTLEVLDAQQTIVRRFSSQDRHPEKHPPLPIAERWFPKPALLESNPGMHRFLWNLTWASSGGSGVDEESEYRDPRGPKVVPGIYTVRLTIDGKPQTQPLTVVMDPRSTATPEVLKEQFRLGQQIFAETLEARRALAEIASLQKQLADREQKLGEKNSDVKSALTDAQTEISKILTKPEDRTGQSAGLQDAFSELVSALGVVESGDRTVPSQAIAVYKESSSRVKTGIAEWSEFKTTKLRQLNRKLSETNLAPIAISEIEQEVQFLMSR
jgi:Condensation domain